jgi:hypothetical protein
MTRKSESITLSVTEEDKAELENIALEFGCTWGEKKPNISKLIKQIVKVETRNTEVNQGDVHDFFRR